MAAAMGVVVLLLVVVLAACSAGISSSSPTVPGDDGSLRYVALGDSYTIGTSVDETARFPDQLTRALDGTPAALDLVANLGVNGYTSADLIREELPALEALDPDVVTVLIGVNDVVQGVPNDQYEANVTTILDSLLELLPPDRIVAVAIPDYTVTPSGADYGDPKQQHDGIVANNASMARLAAAREIAFVDIFDISRGAVDDPTLVATDGLHPSGAQYELWVQRIAPVIQDLLAP